MTTISEVVQQAFRESDLIDETNYPTPTQMSEGVRRLNTILGSLFGHEVGEQLHDVNLGDLNQTYGTPEFPYTGEVTHPPQNSRLIIRSTTAQTVYLVPRPEDGTRIAILDPFSQLSTAPLTINGNGRLIENQNEITINTDGTDRKWMYRADTANWVRVTGLSDASEDMPFPEEFDDYFIGELAMRLNPRHKGVTSQETVRMLARMKQHLQARYRNHQFVPSELGLWISPWYTYGNFFTGRG